MKLSLITRLSSLVTIVHGHTRFARQAEEVSPVVECLDTSEQCETWKIMNLCSVDSIKTSCPKSCDDCDNIEMWWRCMWLIENQSSSDFYNYTFILTFIFFHFFHCCTKSKQQFVRRKHWDMRGYYRRVLELLQSVRQDKHQERL